MLLQKDFYRMVGHQRNEGVFFIRPVLITILPYTEKTLGQVHLPSDLKMSNLSEYM